jgi:GT2 family glycosyltransferase
MVAEEFPSVNLIQSERNLGFGGGNNLGIHGSLGRYVVLLNSDAVVTGNSLPILVEEAQSDSRIGIVGPKLLLPDGRINSTGLVFNHKLCNAADRGVGEVDLGQYDDKRDVIGVCFACVLIKREVIENVGLLDEKMFLYSDDLDYCIRTRLRGYKIRHRPDSIVYHRLGSSTMKRNRAWMRFNLRNRFRCLLKNYESRNALKWGCYNLALHLVVSPIAYLRRLEFVEALLRPYVIFWNFLNLPIKERLQVQMSRVTSDEELFKFSAPSRW